FSYLTVFIGKVLKRLYAEPSSSPAHISSREDEAVLRNLGPNSKEKNLDNVQTSSANASTSTDTPCKSFQGGDNTVLSPRRMYTVSLPPEGYVAVTPDAISISVSENSDSSTDSTGKPEYQGQTKRKRVRRKKQKNSLQNSNNLHGEQTESGMQETLVQDNLQLQQIDSPKISKNKKRKMKKKRQKEKMRAAGLVTKTTSVDFTYQPDKNNREEAVKSLKHIDEKADSILDFLQATQQIYFADNKSESMDSAVNSATAQELLQCLESRTISSSDVILLHQLKSLVLLQDIERLKDALKQFQEQTMMSPDHTKIVTSLFHYWITDILPVKNRK
ncbi:ERIC1 protein, partial [Chionis minor]|nr:ERIC1 protein [Chionis minor]